MKISQLQEVATVDGTDYLLLVVGNTNNKINMQSLAAALQEKFGLTTDAYVDNEIARLIVNDETRIVPTSAELTQAIETRSPLDHNHDTKYSAATHTHSYSQLTGTPTIPNVSEEEVAAMKNDIINLTNMVNAHDEEAQVLFNNILDRLTAIEGQLSGVTVTE